METKQIVGIIALILMIPTLIGLLAFSFHIRTGNPEKNIEEATSLMVDSVTPWWIGLIETLSGWGTFGAIIIIIFFLLIRKFPELS